MTKPEDLPSPVYCVDKDASNLLRFNSCLTTRYRPKENAGVPTPGSTQIAPGTVTLTQDQLAALLKTLGKTSHGDGNSDSPLRISIGEM